MSVSAIQGFKGLVKTSTASGGAVTQLAELKDWTITQSMSEIDATSHDSSGAKEVIAGVTEWAGSAEMLHIQTNVTQQTLFDVLVNGTKVDGEFFPTGSSSDGFYSGAMFITSFEVNSPQEDANTLGAEFVGTGALARSSSSS